MSGLFSGFKEPIRMFQPCDYFDGFYEAYRFQETLNFPRIIFFLIATFSCILSIFTLITMKRSKKVRRSYQFIISQHILISTFGGLLIPMSNLNGIANYGVVFMDKWCDSPHLPFVVFGVLAFSYMAVLVTCFHSFVLNVVWSTNYRFPMFREVPASHVVNGMFVVYDSISSLLFFVAVYLATVTESEDVFFKVAEFDPRIVEIFQEKSVAVIIVTWGFVAVISVVSFGLALFLSATALLIYLNYRVIQKRRNWTSLAVRKQQTMILLMETCNFLMTITCYLPPCTILVMSLFLKTLPNVAVKLPLMLFVYLPLQFLPIFDCLLHVTSCHSVKIFPNVPILNDFTSVISKIPLLSSLLPPPPPVQRDFVVRKGKCAGGEIKIVTVFPWDESTIGANMRHMEHELNRLQKYSGISTSEFSPQIEKTPVKSGSNFAVIYRFRFLTSTCDRVRLFVRNAVSWSSEVLRARVVCECEKVVEMTRV